MSASRFCQSLRYTHQTCLFAVFVCCLCVTELAWLRWIIEEQSFYSSPLLSERLLCQSEPQGLYFPEVPEHTFGSCESRVFVSRSLSSLVCMSVVCPSVFTKDASDVFVPRLVLFCLCVDAGRDDAQCNRHTPPLPSWLSLEQSIPQTLLKL